MTKKKKKAEELTWAEVKAMFAENERRFAESRAEFDKRQAEADKRFAESRAEFEKRQAEAEKRQAERQAEFDKRQAERQAEADKRKAELDKLWAETDRRLEKLCKQVGGIDDNIGHHAEQFFQDTIAETMTFGNQKYDKILTNFKHNGKTVDDVEIDILLINGKSVALIEVKSRIHPKFVKEMANDKIAKFRKLFPEYQKHKAYLGIAGFSFSKAVRDEAQKLGIGIIRQVGNSIEVDAGHLKTY